MKVKRFEAIDMGEALRMVKASMGPNAVILHTRNINKGNSSFGLFGRPLVEVYATAPESGATRGAGFRPAGQNSVIEPERSVEAKKDVISFEPVMDSLMEIRTSLDEISAAKENPDDTVSRINGDVRELKSMISYLIDQSGIENEKGLSRQYLALLRRLKEHGVAEEYSRRLVDEIREKPGEGPSPDIKTLLYVTAAKIRDSLLFGGAIAAPGPGDSKPGIVALVGPTGVGKTTTVAKLAATLSMDNVKVGLITIDTYRIAAVEQLKIYANILNIPLEVILSPGDLKQAIRNYRDKEVILIDTAGRSQRDYRQIKELTRFLDGNDDVDSRLVLSACSSEAQMEEAIKSFSKANVSGLIFTKLDEAAQLGPVLNQHLKTGLPVSYFTTGQSVPEDIEQAQAGAFVKRLFSSHKTESNTIYQ
ncbi:Flagellar biosynthesis protein FlhF [hydrothermal vent metagenome]|uniref:Flagellar biosynthesis protein FlhF n=1 Tax=hydrothermal vent metagenome TaxID=652676 RepID=A0A3B1CBY9_9ZZZZ